MTVYSLSVSMMWPETDCVVRGRGVVSAGNVSHWAALIYGAAGIDRPALVIAVGHEVKDGRYRQTGGERRDKTRGVGYSTESWTKNPWPLRIISGLCFAAIKTHKRLKMNAFFLNNMD